MLDALERILAGENGPQDLEGCHQLWVPVSNSTTEAAAAAVTRPPQALTPAKARPLPEAFFQEGNPTHHKRKIRK